MTSIREKPMAANRTGNQSIERFSLKVATVTLSVYRSHRETTEKMMSLVRDILRSHPDVDLIQFGECILGWYAASEMALVAESVDGENCSALRALAKAHGVYISFGMPESIEGRLFNTQVLIGRGGDIECIHRKYNLKSKERQAGFISGADRFSTVWINGCKVALLICSDAADLKTLLTLRRSKADLILHSVADDEDPNWLVARIMANLLDSWLITANRYGMETCFWNGHTFIANPKGVLLQCSKDAEVVLVQEIIAEQASPWVKGYRFVNKGLRLLSLVIMNFGSIRRLL